MSYRPAPAKRWFVLLALLMAGLIGLARWKGWWPGPRGGPASSGLPTLIPSGGSQPPRPASGTSGSREAEGERHRVGRWDELHGCTLVEERLNDGDSFVVRHGRAEFTVRLYFADCPEKTRHQYNGPRLAEQGQYFGGLTEAETVAVGEEARDFSLGLLRAAPFRVLTRWEKVFDSDRIYAFVTVESGDLAERLIKEGLARIYTKGENRPGGKTAKSTKQQLLYWEQQAKTARRGAWGRRSGGKSPKSN